MRQNKEDFIFCDDNDFFELPCNVNMDLSFEARFNIEEIDNKNIIIETVLKEQIITVKELNKIIEEVSKGNFKNIFNDKTNAKILEATYKAVTDIGNKAIKYLKKDFTSVFDDNMMMEKILNHSNIINFEHSGLFGMSLNWSLSTLKYAYINGWDMLVYRELLYPTAY